MPLRWPICRLLGTLVKLRTLRVALPREQKEVQDDINPRSKVEVRTELVVGFERSLKMMRGTYYLLPINYPKIQNRKQ